MNMEDEMGEYREKIERRYGDRRLKSDRREYAAPPARRIFEVADVLIFIVLGIALYFFR